MEKIACFQGMIIFHVRKPKRLDRSISHSNHFLIQRQEKLCKIFNLNGRGVLFELCIQRGADKHNHHMCRQSR